ncbi:Aste57867_10553 [Aphanomyces stellatus]|uniref:Aste57867_10553 protein n=1 Tax=Aphanomyces stellatus TaxID=120398 RepID=A0A485KQN4_9STRA|nr:hypothetical protein As57867_010513 [Aphanomyces stellatus]VFT87426.1 Aste57867_10553 [Aphanomyces stellatus]
MDPPKTKDATSPTQHAAAPPPSTNLENANSGSTPPPEKDQPPNTNSVGETERSTSRGGLRQPEDVATFKPDKTPVALDPQDQGSPVFASTTGENDDAPAVAANPQEAKKTKPPTTVPLPSLDRTASFSAHVDAKTLRPSSSTTRVAPDETVHVVQTRRRSVMTANHSTGRLVDDPHTLTPSPSELFYAACQHGDVALVTAQLAADDAHIDVNRYTKLQDTPLCVACVEEQIDIVEILLAEGTIDVNLSNYSHPPLALAAGVGRPETVQLLLHHPNIDVNIATAKRTPLTTACIKGHLEIVQLLCARSDLDINLVDQHGFSGLFTACLHGRTAVVAFLLTQPGLDVNICCGGDLPLTVAASYHHVDIVRLLLAAPTIDVNRMDQDGYSALFHACEEGLADVVALLLDHPAIQIDDGKRSAVTRTVEKGFASVLRLLLARHPIERTSHSTTELSYAAVACQRGHLDVVQLFLELGVFQNDSPDTKRVAIYEALANRHAAIARLLLIERQDIVFDPASKGQATLLHAAAEAGYDDIVTALLPDAEDIGGLDSHDRTALQLAAAQGHWNVVLAILLADLPFELTPSGTFVEKSDHSHSWAEFADVAVLPKGEDTRRSELTKAVVLHFPEATQLDVATRLLHAEDAHGRVVETYLDAKTKQLLLDWSPSAPPPSARPTSSQSRKMLRTPGAVSVSRLRTDEPTTTSSSDKSIGASAGQ